MDFFAQVIFLSAATFWGVAGTFIWLYLTIVLNVLDIYMANKFNFSPCCVILVFSNTGYMVQYCHLKINKNSQCPAQKWYISIQIRKIRKCLADVQWWIVQIVGKSYPTSHFPRTKKGNACVPMLIARAYLKLRGSYGRESWLNAKWANVQLSQFARATTDSNDTCWALPLLDYCIQMVLLIYLNTVNTSLNHPLQTEWFS